MLFFWHRYELPAVAHGLVSVEHPRMGTSMSSFQEEQRGRYEPPVPSVAAPPPHQLVRQLSHGTSASRVSRQASSTALFNSGEDGDESYIYFMGGEVVMHREDRRAPSPIAHPGGVESVGDATDDGPRRVGGIPDHILAEVGVLHNNATSTGSFDAMDNDDELFHSFDGGGGVIVDPPETSALQAILHVHETPRTDNLSRENRHIDGSREESADTMAGTAPVFPFHTRD
jgi:hypothetical protein